MGTFKKIYKESNVIQLFEIIKKASGTSQNIEKYLNKLKQSLIVLQDNDFIPEKVAFNIIEKLREVDEEIKKLEVAKEKAKSKKEKKARLKAEEEAEEEAAAEEAEEEAAAEEEAEKEEAEEEAAAEEEAEKEEAEEEEAEEAAAEEEEAERKFLSSFETKYRRVKEDYSSDDDW